jgi:hypothetical protein
MESQLLKLLSEVHDEQSFLSFVQALTTDRTNAALSEKIKSDSENTWENITIESYLEAASAWASDSNFGRAQQSVKFNDNCWNQFANFLYAGKIYE